jgi:hypothetical protein
MPVAGKVEREQRPVECESNRVPRVRVLCTTVQENEIGFADTEGEAADELSATNIDGEALDGGRPRERDAELLGVLVKVSELVISDRHAAGA